MSGIKILKTIPELRAWRASLPPGDSVGFVPTMGALHEGHLSLVKQSVTSTRQTIASIFVNPLQFGPQEDFAAYPRTFANDCALLARAGAHAVFHPQVQELYAPGASTFVVEEQISQGLCGEFRPGHFKGVATVVLKLFNLVQPQKAFFGLKDLQQCAVIDRMVRDLNMPVDLIWGETVREPDGLALSSRNRYLSPEEREKSIVLIRSLRAMAELVKEGETRVEVLLARGKHVLAGVPEFKTQYLEIRSFPSWVAPGPTLDTLPPGSWPFAAVAGYLGKTRLIDNLSLA